MILTVSSIPNAILTDELLDDAINYETYADKTILDTNLNRIYFLENLEDKTKVSIFKYQTKDNKFVYRIPKFQKFFWNNYRSSSVKYR